MTSTNDFGQPVGDQLTGWTAPSFPPRRPLTGDHVALEPLEDAHADRLWPAFERAPESLWTYMPIGPFASSGQFGSTVARLAADPDLAPYAVVVGGVPCGFLTYLRIEPTVGCIEIGSIAYSPALQRTVAATEAIRLMIANAFTLGYRRVEWKCDHLNAPSRRAAERYGFTFEGIFRQATVYKGRNRDTAWFSIVDGEWAAIDAAFAAWLAPTNFGPDGAQRRSLVDVRSDTPPA